MLQTQVAVVFRFAWPASAATRSKLSPASVFYQVADLNLEVDLLYFDTTSTYFEREQEDEFRRRGHSKDHRPDLPQIVVGFAVTAEGIPVRSWCWAGNTADMSVVPQVKQDLIGWKLGRVITVLHRGFASEDDRGDAPRGVRRPRRTVTAAHEDPAAQRHIFQSLNVKEPPLVFLAEPKT